MFAVGIIASALLLVVGTLLSVFNSSQKNVDTTAGALVAEKILAEHMYALTSNDAVKQDFFSAAHDSGTAPFRQGEAATLNNTLYTYALYAPTLAAPGSGPGPYDEDGNKVKRIELVVSWWQPDPAQASANTPRQNYGMLRTQMVRLVTQ